jgi:hypothetical protein
MLSTRVESQYVGLIKTVLECCVRFPHPIVVQFPHFPRLPPVQWHHNAEFLHNNSSSAGQRALRPAYAISFLVIKVGRRLPAVGCDSR